MTRFVLAFLAACVTPVVLHAQAGESDLRVFGYLQASFYQEVYPNDEFRDSNTFTVQQLDLMLQKDLGRRWSSFVDLLFTNNYSSRANTGTLELQQAWVRYRRSRYLAIKAGLFIPRFNYLNEIKNKMPVLPYIIRPIVYESSFQEDIGLDEYVPQRAYFQVYGYAPVGNYKIEYNGYLGNSPNVNRDPNFGQTGLDTTDTFLTGGRVGIRHAYFQAGFSMTHDKVDYLEGVVPDTLSLPALSFNGTTRLRFGGDLLVEYRRFRLEGEVIAVNYDEPVDGVENDKNFFYGTLGYNFMDKLFIYASYWQLEQYFSLREPGEIVTTKWTMKIPTGGVSYQMNDRITLKGAVARGRQAFDLPDVGYPKRVFYFYALAVSVMF